jgi:hypothetical protein
MCTSFGTTFLRFITTLTNPFLFHAFLEIPAAFTFFLYPSRQSRSHSPQAHAVIRQYAVLLMSSVLVALIFAVRPMEEVSGQVAGALALYHLAPIWRAAGRLMAGDAILQSLSFAAAHGLGLTGLMLCCWEEYLGKQFMA